MTVYVHGVYCSSHISTASVVHDVTNYLPSFILPDEIIIKIEEQMEVVPMEDIPMKETTSVATGTVYNF